MADLNFVQVPPQSTGKRVATEARTQLDYDNLVGNLFIIGQVVTGATSGATGTVTGLSVSSQTSGFIILKSVVGTFVDNEDIEVAATPIASVNGSNFFSLEGQKIVIADPNNPSRMQKIDRFGATLNSFADGTPIFSPFGLMMVGQSQIIKDYRFAYNSRDSDFWDQEISGGTVNYESDAGLILLSNPTTNGSVASRTSHFYHPYYPGVGTLYESCIAIGDTGKTNVKRRWGFFDDDNGAFWELDGTTLKVVIRSNADGTAVDTAIEQADFNEDQLNGTDNLGFALNVSTGNIYWIDIQWLGAGRVRFGVIEPNGSRILAHDFENMNTTTTPTPFMKTATLPVRIEQQNTGTSGSTSEMRWVGGSVKHTALTPISGDGIFTTSGNLKTVDSTSGPVPIISGRPKQIFEGVPNRGIIRLRSVSYVNDGTNAAKIVVGSTVDALMGGESFSSHSSKSITEIDRDATSVTYVDQLSSRFIAAKSVIDVEVQTDNSVHQYEAFLFADGATQPVICWSAEAISGQTDINIILNWEEIIK